MTASDTYDIAIIGGGLAGLTLAIQQAASERSVVLFEKEQYPFHKVCGEYISMESYDFLKRLGLDLDSMQLPKIGRLQVSSPSGKLLKHKLDLGGFGISRYTLDHELATIAKNKGVRLLENCKVSDVKFAQDHFHIDTGAGTFTSRICAGAWGKKSNLDTKLERAFIAKSRDEKNYVGIKYHVQLDFPADLIGLHNFENGYCGISRIEANKYCLCYLSAAENLKRYNGDIRKMEQEVLMKNPYLKKYFSEARFLFDAPLAISNIRIGYKDPVERHILVLGDAAGNIAPLSGNGMSMAMRSAFMLSQLLDTYFKENLTRAELEAKYAGAWHSAFRRRIAFSAQLQKLLKNTGMTDLAIASLKAVPFLRSAVVRSTHGKPF